MRGGRGSHELAGSDPQSRPVSLRVLAEETFILFEESARSGIAEASLAACHRAGFNLRLGQQAPRIASTLGLVSAGLGVALVPASIQRVQVDGVAYRRLLPRERPSAVLCRSARPRDPSDCKRLRHLRRRSASESRAVLHVGRLAAPGVKVSEVGVGEQGAEPVAQDQAGVATAERGTGDTGGVVGHGRDWRLRAKRHGHSPDGKLPQRRQPRWASEFATRSTARGARTIIARK